MREGEGQVCIPNSSRAFGCGLCICDAEDEEEGEVLGSSTIWVGLPRGENQMLRVAGRLADMASKK